MSSPKARIDQITDHLTNDSRPRLDGLVCIITGAGSEIGIGRATAWVFAKHGPKAIYVTDYQYDLLPSLAKDIQEKYPSVTVIPKKVDATSEADVSGVIKDAIDAFGRLDVFFANAGLGSDSSFVNGDASSCMNIMRVNALSVFLAIKFASEAMKITGGKGGKEEASGSIIATASVAGIRSGAGGADYSASKAAVVNFVQTGASHLTGTNIRVNAVCP
ncbi:4682_t:CDS:2, partial [Paraglomus occultum]